MVKVIINADDLGISHEVNTEIAEAISSGYISSATILANSRYWDEIHAIVSKYPNVSFGVHLNLTEGKALTDSSTFKKQGVVDNENNFTKIIRELDLSDEDLKEAVFDEFEAQLYKVKYIESIPVSHIDGHHHIHSANEFHDILMRLLDKYQIYKVRNRYNYPQGSGRTLMKKIMGA